MSIAHSPYAEQVSADSFLALPKIVPPFVREIGRLAPELGLGGAVASVLEDANIHLDVAGDLSRAEGEGLVIAADHRHRMEPLLVQAMMDKVGRRASHVVAMPTSMAGRILQASGPEGRDHVIPVVPSGNSRENRPSLTNIRAVYRYHQHPNVFGRSKEELRHLNAAAMIRAAGEVSVGSTVMIHPAGGQVEAGTKPWLPGFGRIIQQLAPDAQAESQVAVLRPDDFPVGKVTAALALRGMGIHPRPQTIAMRTEVLGTPEEMFGSLAAERTSEAAQRLSDITSDHYRRSFGVGQ